MLSFESINILVSEKGFWLSVLFFMLWNLYHVKYVPCIWLLCFLLFIAYSFEYARIYINCFAW